MSITERDRRDLYDGLEAALGPERADTLMTMLPNQPADQLLTISFFQTEMAAHRSEIRAEMAEHRGEIGAEMSEHRSEIRAEMAELRSDLKGDFDSLRVEVKGDVLRVENSLSLRMADLQTSMNRWVLGLTTANVLGMVTALVT